jgi:hypothetical protein
VRVRLDKKATSISLLVALGVRQSDQDGQKVLLARERGRLAALLVDLIQRGLKTPENVIVDGAPGLENALAALWSGPMCRFSLKVADFASKRLVWRRSASPAGSLIAENGKSIEIQRRPRN